MNVLFLSACCDASKSHQVVSQNCSFINYNQGIDIADKQVSSCVINTFETTSNSLVQSLKISPTAITPLPEGGYYLELGEPLPTNLNWELVINGAVQYRITEIKVGVWGGKTMFCEHFMCGLKSYKVNGVQKNDDYITLN